ncbi:MAG TPA: hypothetical protein VNM14_24845 [Planctomycetota bacterium]|jgi:hypothetical protein|nr:hypothetical protein [Planctomycetota bacterium]
MSIGMDTAVPLAAALGAVLPVLLLRSPSRSGRGWCGKCQTPDLWIVFRSTARSRAWTFLTWIAHAGLTLCAGLLVRTRGFSDPRDWVILGLLAAAELLLAQRARTARRRVIRCRMCEAEAEPQDLRRARG